MTENVRSGELLKLSAKWTAFFLDCTACILTIFVKSSVAYLLSR